LISVVDCGPARQQTTLQNPNFTDLHGTNALHGSPPLLHSLQAVERIYVAGLALSQNQSICVIWRSDAVRDVPRGKTSSHRLAVAPTPSLRADHFCGRCANSAHQSLTTAKIDDLAGLVHPLRTRKSMREEGHAMKRPILIGVSAGLALLIAVLAFMYAQQQSRAKFDGIDRALKAVEVAASSGVSHDVFREKVTALALEDRLLQGKVSGKRESDLLRAYEMALEAWQDSLKVWDAYFDPESAKLRFSLREAERIVEEHRGNVRRNSGTEASASDDYFYGGQLSKVIIQRYALASYDYTKPGRDPLEPVLSLDSSLHKIWQEANKLGVAVELQRRN
jgi:hypothetical protein